MAGVIHQPYWGENQIGRTIWAIVGAGAYGIDIVRGKPMPYMLQNSLLHFVAIFVYHCPEIIVFFFVFFF